jgi:hypothetical protein
MGVLHCLRDSQRFRGRRRRVIPGPRASRSRPSGPRLSGPRLSGPRPSSWSLAAAALAALGGVACGTEFSPPSDPELAEALGLPPRTPIYRFDLADRQGSVGLFPAEWDIAEGGVVQFVTRDPRVYSIHFERTGMSAAAWQFLEALGQESSPPLTREGARFVLSFEDAPPGPYPFRVEGQSEPVRGEIRVRGPP